MKRTFWDPGNLNKLYLKNQHGQQGTGVLFGVSYKEVFKAGAKARMHFESCTSEHCKYSWTPAWNVTALFLCNSCKFISSSLLISLTRTFAPPCPDLAQGVRAQIWARTRFLILLKIRIPVEDAFKTLGLFPIWIWTGCQWSVFQC